MRGTAGEVWETSGEPPFGIVQKVFSEKASAIARMRQKCVKMGLLLLGKEERPKCVRNPSELRKNASKMRGTPFGENHLLDDTGP